MTTVYIRGSGSRAGGRQVSSLEIDARLGKPAGWLESQSGIRSRYHVADGETQESLAVAASLDALADSGLTADAIDMVLFAAAVGRQPIPATAALIKRELGLEGSPIPAFDINATCLSAVAALDVARLYIAAGRCRHVLIVASEIASRALPWDKEPATAALFGDGAAAWVVSDTPGESLGLEVGELLFETWSSGYDLCTLQAGGTGIDFQAEPDRFRDGATFHMDGKALFRLSRKVLPAFLARLLDRNAVTARDIDVVIPHQASPLALAMMSEKCGFAADRVVSEIRDWGNLVAASLPMTLDHALKAGRIQAGHTVMLIGTSAGVSLGGLVLRA